MNIDEQTELFIVDITNLVNRYLEEFDLNQSTVIGALEKVKLEVLLIEAVEFKAEENDEDDDEDYDELTFNFED
tara:strand:+ start:157 stop:378 length:222 start_codon:yes stop_codon:yes gene_type:complete